MLRNLTHRPPKPALNHAGVRPRRRGDRMMRRRDFITLLGGALFVSIRVSAAAQEGYFGVFHDRWHEDIYLKLNTKDGGGTCCNLMYCHPTQSRMVGDHYEAQADDEQTPRPNHRRDSRVCTAGAAQ